MLSHSVVIVAMTSVTNRSITDCNVRLVHCVGVCSVCVDMRAVIPAINISCSLVGQDLRFSPVGPGFKSRREKLSLNHRGSDIGSQ